MKIMKIMRVARLVALVGIVAITLVRIVQTILYVINERLVYKLSPDLWWALVDLWLITAVIIILIVIGRIEKASANENSIISTYDLLIGVVFVWIWSMLDIVRMIR